MNSTFWIEAIRFLTSSHTDSVTVGVQEERTFSESSAAAGMILGSICLELERLRVENL